MSETLITNDDLNIENINTIDWTPEHEKILIEWADKAMCYRWLHSKANAMYNSLNAWYTIPVIVISTLTGTANFAQERVPLAYQNFFVMIVGGFNILAGIITTIQQFLKITQLKPLLELQNTVLILFPNKNVRILTASIFILKYKHKMFIIKLLFKKGLSSIRN